MENKDRRLKEEDYINFLNEFSNGINKELPGTCFYTYGSINNSKGFIPGTSDIDGGIILNSGVITPKNEIRTLAKLYFASMLEKGIDTDINLLDRVTNDDGRFLSYSPTMADYIKESAKVLTGSKEYLLELNGLNFKNGDLNHVAMNLRSLRNRLLTSEYDSEENYKNFSKGVLSNIKKSIKLPKLLVLIQNETLVTGKLESISAYESLLGRCIKIDGLVELNDLVKEPVKLIKQISDKNRAIELLEISLESAEIMIGEYIYNFPEITNKEVIQ
ncbi:MAG: hypothetical protein WC867_08455 [Candidatus Pacearchaeota archaeon]|jgi:hypothetical protein